MTVKLSYVFMTDDPLEAKHIADKLGIALSIATGGAGEVLPTGPGMSNLPAAAPAGYAPAGYAPPAAAPAYAPPPAAAPAPPPAAAPAQHDAADQAILNQGWSLDAHLKPLVGQLAQKFGNEGPARLQALLAPFGTNKLSGVAPKHWPDLHAAITKAVA